MLKWVVITSLLLCALTSETQTYYFANYGVQDGLAQSNVSGIVQDSAGFYWIATEGGVSRFDGNNFINYTTEHGLADNNVSAIFIDRDQNIWLGHENGTLTKFDGTSFTQIHSRLLPSDKKIFSFFQDRTGNLWVCTATAGAIRIMNPSKSSDKGMHTKVYSAREDLSQYVFSASEDKYGNMWFLTDVGVKILDSKTRKFEFFRPQGMPVGQISSLCLDKNGNPILGTTAGFVSRYDIKKETFEPLITNDVGLRTNVDAGPNVIYTIFEDHLGNVWASGSNHGVFRYSPSKKNVTVFNTSSGLASNKIRCITEDREGNVMLGSSGEGLQVFSGQKFVSYSKKDGLGDNQVWAIHKDRKNRFWFGTNGGITIYDPAALPEKRYRNIGVGEGLRSSNVRAIVEDSNGDLWIGTWGGKVIKYDMAREEFVTIAALNELVNNLVGSLMIDRNNKLWIGTYEGIVCYDLSTSAVNTIRTINGLSDNDVTCLYEDSQGRVWIGTRQKGVTLFNKGKFIKIGRPEGLLYGSVSSITEDGKKRLWIGTEGGGAFVYDGKAARNYKAKNGLASDFITLTVTDQEGHVWLGTSKGLNKVVDDSTFVSYSSGDGFTAMETKPRAVFRDNENYLWFGTVNGAFRYDFSEERKDAKPPVTRLLGFRVNLRDRNISNEVNLSYDENSLIFDFVGISLDNPGGVTYKVMLEGYDDGWHAPSRPGVVEYPNLPHDKYRFHLIACNNSGQCSTPVTMRITITPPYWQTWWFYLLVVSGIVSALFAYIKIRERKLMREKRVLEHKVSQRTAEVVEKNKALDEINKDITASIRYAKRIQDAILPPDDFVRKHLPNTFVLFKPKDIVSGDFYWLEEKKDTVIFAAVDCTGHGVPGAFMSIVGHNLLDRVIAEQNITQPARILDELNRSITDTLRQQDLEDNTLRDGMDIALCTFNRKTSVLEFAGAYNPLWIVRGKEIIEIKANKFPIGNSRSGDTKRFTNHEIPLSKGDTLYIFSDGYSDQFGGPNGKKFKSSTLKQLLLNSQDLSMDQQRELLDKTIEDWRGNHEQVDDILIIGTRYN
jgi:ligand-binding sensor domain-containing protein/serine phosphatase RsbU (regulator of sigma subunit)